MTIKGFFRWLGILIMIAYLGISNHFCPPAQADILDDLHNSTLTGYVLDGESKAFIEHITAFEPKGEKFLGLPLTIAEYTLQSFDGKDIVDRLWMLGRIGSEKSDSFFLSYYKLDEPRDTNAYGFANDTTSQIETGLETLIPGVHITDGGSFFYSLRLKWEFSPGYYLGADFFMTTEKGDPFNPYTRDGKFFGRHNFEPDGSSYGEIFVIDYGNETTIGGGAGFTFHEEPEYYN